MDQGRGQEEVPLTTNENDIHKGDPPCFSAELVLKEMGRGMNDCFASQIWHG
jgi:hypothetical protein